MSEHWGRRYSYGVMAPISVPKLSRESAPPTQMQKGHLHFGCGGDSIPRSAVVAISGKTLNALQGIE